MDVPGQMTLPIPGGWEPWKPECRIAYDDLNPASQALADSFELAGVNMDTVVLPGD